MDIGFGVVRKPICKQCAHAYIVIRVTAARLRLLLYALMCIRTVGEPVVIKQRGRGRAKTTGVILTYDFLNSPTAILLAVF